MRALSLFSGVGGIDLGLDRAGIRVVGQCEADAWRRAVLAERFPGVPCYPDVRDVHGERLLGRDEPRAATEGRRGQAEHDAHGRVGLIAGGFPCQDVSVAGRRAGLAGQRTGLFWEFHRIIDTLRPRWVLLENVPGLLSSNGGRDFYRIIDALDEIGYVGAWRVLDSRFFGVPQRRRRVFILCADIGFDPRGERCAEVLAVGTRCPRHPRTGGTPGTDAAGPAPGSPGSGGELVTAPMLVKRYGKGTDSDATDALIAYQCHGSNVGPMGTLRAGNGNEAGGVPFIAATLSSGGHPNSNMPGRRKEDDVNLVAFGHTQGLDHQASEHVTPTLRKQGGGGAVAYALRRDPGGTGQGHNTNHVPGESGVRRLTPRECERLQGFPDDWTLIPWNDKPSPDSRRYAALGDAVTVNVAEWIARRIVHLEKETPS